MKHNAETEIDLLLRRHGRREGTAARVLGDGSGAKDDASHHADNSGLHLDADELNAFAEGALPAPSRARYAAHLADCDACRKVFTELALLNSAASEEKRVVVAAEPSEKSSWRAWIAAFFAPAVLRFAVPAFGLLIVGAILFVITQRQQKQSTLVVQNEQARSVQQSNSANISATPEEHRAADTSTATAQANANSRESTLQEQKKIASGEQSSALAPSSQNAPSQSNVKTPDQAKPEANTDEQTLADRVEGGKRDEDKREAEATRSEPFRERGRAREEERAAAPIAAPPPASAAGGTVAKEKTEAPKDAPKDQPTRPSNKTIIDGMSAENNETGPQNKGYGGAAARPNATLSNRKRAARNTANDTKSGEDNISRDDASETRKVAGRTFRRQGGAWVDTAYNSSRATVNIKRGSEQYRALTADEPAIATIANQLGGEVVIIWKGRAYRIR